MTEQRELHLAAARDPAPLPAMPVRSWGPFGRIDRMLRPSSVFAGGPSIGSVDDGRPPTDPASPPTFLAALRTTRERPPGQFLLRTLVDPPTT